MAAEPSFGEEPETEENASTGRRMDPELKCMAAIVRQVDDLQEPARGRVVAWLAARYASQ